MIWSRLEQAVAGKKILVFGLGRQGGGVTVAQLLHEAGALVRGTDQRPAEELGSGLSTLDSQIPLTLGTHLESDIAWADIIVKNPAVPASHPLLQLARTQGKIVTNEAALTVSLVREQTIGITGTRGKTTTTLLTHHLLKENGLPAILGGNLPGKPSLSLLKEAPQDALFVLELSSFQIEAFAQHNLSPHLSAITNIYPDHLDRYSNLHEYAKTKALLFRYQQPGDICILANHHDFFSDLNEECQPETYKQVLTAADFARVQETYHSPLPGNHNWENIAFAEKMVQHFGLTQEQIQSALHTFPGAPYRFQTVAIHNGIRCINDTTSTTPTALEKALDTLSGENFILICGGTTKHLPFSATLKEKVRTALPQIIWLTGSGTKELLTALNHHPSHLYNNMSEAVQAAVKLARQKEARVLALSPGFSSFELFKNEFDRGDQFNAAITDALTGETQS